MRARRCRFCGSTLRHTFVDLGMQPLANAYLERLPADGEEPFYPLHAFVCDRCLLVQLEEIVKPDRIFSHYPYFSSYSDSWLQHARVYADMAVERFALGEHSYVIEIASNDGYLLQYFAASGIPVLGIEPAANVAAAAMEKGIPTVVKFFGEALAEELVRDRGQADLLIGNNILAHVPDLNGFVRGMRILLKSHGVVTMEFPHLLRLMAETQFDTIYHEHFSYFSLIMVEKVFAAHGLALFDVEELPTHGGSLRLYARHAADSSPPVTRRVRDLRAREEAAGLAHLDTYLRFGERVKETKRQLLEFLQAAKRQGRTVAGYGAPAKGNTLLNYCGIRADLLPYTVDRSPHKQGRFLPGTHIPIRHPDMIRQTKPDYVLLLPWNLKDEIMAQLSYVQGWGGRFVIPIPELVVLP